MTSYKNLNTPTEIRSVFKVNAPTNLKDVPDKGVCCSKIFRTPNSITEKWKTTRQLFGVHKDKYAGKNCTDYITCSDDSEFQIKTAGKYCILYGFANNIDFSNMTGLSTSSLDNSLYDIRLDIQGSTTKYVECIKSSQFKVCQIPLSSGGLLAYVRTFEKYFNCGDIIKLRTIFKPSMSKNGCLLFQISNYSFHSNQPVYQNAKNMAPINTLPLPINTLPLPINTLPLPINTLPLPINTLPLPINTLPLPINTLPLPINTLPLPINTLPLPINTLPLPIVNNDGMLNIENKPIEFENPPVGNMLPIVPTELDTTCNPNSIILTVESDIDKIETGVKDYWNSDVAIIKQDIVTVEKDIIAVEKDIVTLSHETHLAINEKKNTTSRPKGHRNPSFPRQNRIKIPPVNNIQPIVNGPMVTIDNGPIPTITSTPLPQMDYSAFFKNTTVKKVDAGFFDNFKKTFLSLKKRIN